MLLLILKTGDYSVAIQHLNTSHVIVNPIKSYKWGEGHKYLNTSHVIVNRIEQNELFNVLYNLNTSHVIVNRLRPCQRRLKYL